MRGFDLPFGVDQRVGTPAAGGRRRSAGSSACAGRHRRSCAPVRVAGRAAASERAPFDRCGAYAADQDAGSRAVGWAESMPRPSVPGRRWQSAVRAVGRGTWCGRGAATVKSSREGWLSTGRRGFRSSRGCWPRGSILGGPTGCSVRRHALRFGRGSRREVRGRRGIWTARRSSRYGLPARPDRGRRSHRLRRPRPPCPNRRRRRARRKPARSWKACFGSRS